MNIRWPLTHRMKFVRQETINIYRMLPYIITMYFHGQFDGTSTNMALPIMQQELGQGVAISQWFSTITTITQASFSIPMASVGVHVGVSIATCIGSALVMLCDVAVVFPDKFWEFLLIRFFAGLGQCAVMQTSYALVQNLLPQEKRFSFTRQQTLLLSAISMAGPLIASQVIDHIGWRWNFIIIAAACLIRIIFVSSCMEKVQIVANKFDIWSSILLICQLATLCFSLTILAYYKYVLFGSLFAVSMCLLVAFVFRERKSEHPLINKTCLHQPIIGMAMIGSIAFMLGLSEAIIVPQYFNHKFGNMGTLGYINAARLSLSFISSLLTHFWLERQTGKSMMILISSTVLALVCYILQAALTFNIYAFSAAYLLKAFVNAPIQMVVRPIMMAIIPKSVVHHVSAFTSTLQTIFTCLGQTVVGMLLQICLSAFDQNYEKSMSVMYFFFIAVAIVLLGFVLNLAKHWKSYGISPQHADVKESLLEDEDIALAVDGAERSLLDSEHSYV